jgi:Flp pilus assembly protein TadD
VHAVALNSAGKADAAMTVLRDALIKHPSNGDILSALASFAAARGQNAEAASYRDRLRALAGNR